MAQITCKNVSLGYEGKVVTSKVNFQVEAGDYLCIVGENDTGKSTLMKALLRLKPTLEGTIELGEHIKQSDIGYLPQQTQIQKDFPASVREIVMTGFLGNGKLHPFYSKEERQKSSDIMKKLGIEELSELCYRDLSGGQQQRVLLARALCATEKMLLLDEPVAGLDPKVTAELYELIERLNKEERITIIMVSHDMRAAVKYASHVLHLSYVPLFYGKKEEYVEKGFHLWEGSEEQGSIGEMND